MDVKFLNSASYSEMPWMLFRPALKYLNLSKFLNEGRFLISLVLISKYSKVLILLNPLGKSCRLFKLTSNCFKRVNLPTYSGTAWILFALRSRTVSFAKLAISAGKDFMRLLERSSFVMFLKVSFGNYAIWLKLA